MCTVGRLQSARTNSSHRVHIQWKRFPMLPSWTHTLSIHFICLVAQTNLYMKLSSNLNAAWRAQRCSVDIVHASPAVSPSSAGRSCTRPALGACARSSVPHAHSGVGGAHRKRQRAREREAAEQSARHRRGMQAEPDKDERLLAWVYRHLPPLVQNRPLVPVRDGL